MQEPALKWRSGSSRKRSAMARPYWLASSMTAAKDSSPAAYLPPVYDEYTVAYKDRSAVLNPEYAKHATRTRHLQPDDGRGWLGCRNLEAHAQERRAGRYAKPLRKTQACRGPRLRRGRKPIRGISWRFSCVAVRMRAACSGKGN